MLAAHLNGNVIRAQCSADEWAGIQMVNDYLESLFIARPNAVTMLVEHEVLFPQQILPAQDVAGIADLLVYDAQDHEVWSIEYKFGHVYVSEKRNPQLLFNACAAWWDVPISKLHLVVIQPRCHSGEPIREDVVTSIEMAEFQIRTEAAIAAAESPNPPLTPGTHCRYCECELTCPARERQAVAVVDPYATQIEQLDGLPLPSIPEMPNDKLGYLLRNKDALKEWLSAAEKEALRRAMSGQDIPDFKLVEALARRSFDAADVEGVAARLSALTGFIVSPDAFKEDKLVGVIAAEKKLIEHANNTAAMGEKRQAVADIKVKMAFLTPRDTSGNLTLVPLTDSRPAVNRIASGFAGVNLPPVP